MTKRLGRKLFVWYLRSRGGGGGVLGSFGMKKYFYEMNEPQLQK